MAQRDGRDGDIPGISRRPSRHDDIPSPGKSSLVDQFTMRHQARAPGLGPTTYDIEAGVAPGANSAASGTTNARPADRAPAVAPPAAGIDKPGFIDNSKGAMIYTAPAEAGECWYAMRHFLRPRVSSRAERTRSGSTGGT
jgi:hypothetical protein